MNDVAAALDVLDRGGVVVLPTETVYGVGARLDRPAGIEAIYQIKGRPAEKVLQVLVSSADDLSRVAQPVAGIDVLLERFVPGPLTLVLPARDGLPAAVSGGGTVGVRAPDNAIALELLRHSGPLAASSANRSGEATPTELSGVAALFGDRVGAYLDGGTIAGGTPSTVLDVTGAEPVVLRAGALATADIEATLGRTVRLAGAPGSG